ncbi:DUF3592 domain-containing protein [Gallaecimonas mangrovi]|uniref:DUF3592 domain-containing protein n=1 Tax=Gallaecimonas mangrovi TaxID=2291597 RepID=UPI000E202BB1|nr:DUF3592 domain-containing protein [Gallaecimonas mangrovi]
MSKGGCVLNAFSVIGLLMLAGTFYSIYSTHTFLKHAVTAPGQVVDLDYSQSSDGSGTYHPEVAFKDQYGQNHIFISNSGSNPPSYDRGDSVEVIYLPSKPEQARINSFLSVWFVPIICSIFGVVFSAIGWGGRAVAVRQTRSIDKLKTQGRAIEANITSAEKDESYSRNGQHPFIIFAQWQNPATQEIHVFKSDAIWFDPLPYLDRDVVTVMLAPRDNSQYWMDTRFLPKLAE